MFKIRKELESSGWNFPYGTNRNKYPKRDVRGNPLQPGHHHQRPHQADKGMIDCSHCATKCLSSAAWFYLDKVLDQEWSKSTRSALALPIHPWPASSSKWSRGLVGVGLFSTLQRLSHRLYGANVSLFCSYQYGRYSYALYSVVLS